MDVQELKTAGAVVLIDPLVSRDDEERFYRALDRDVQGLGLPMAIVLTNPWHRRSSAELAERCRATVHVAGESLPPGFDAYPGGMRACASAAIRRPHSSRAPSEAAQT